MQELIGEGRETRKIGQVTFLTIFEETQKKGGSASCMILFKVVTRQMIKGDATMPAHQEKKYYMMMNHGI